MQAAQKRYKRQYNKKVKPVTYQVDEWVLVKFPAEESGRMRKLSRPWHGPYHITKINGPNVSALKVYHPQNDGITVHLSRVKHCPVNFPAGFYWYGSKSKGPGRPPKWVEQLLAGKQTDKVVVKTADENTSSDKQTETSVPQTASLEVKLITEGDDVTLLL